VKSDANGEVDLGDLARHLGDDVAAFMITVPNTLGNFEPRIVDITEMCHARACRSTWTAPTSTRSSASHGRAISVSDVCHFNLHKTFTTRTAGRPRRRTRRREGAPRAVFCPRRSS